MSYVVAVPVAATTRGTVVALRRSEVLAGSRGPGARTPSLLDAESPALIDLTLQGILCGIGILRSDHLDEAKATALASVWITHNVALLNSAVLLEKNSDLLLGQTGMDASDEEVGARVDLAVVAATLAAVLARRGNITAQMSVQLQLEWVWWILTARCGHCKGRRGCECRHRGRHRESESGSAHRRAGSLSDVSWCPRL